VKAIAKLFKKAWLLSLLGVLALVAVIIVVGPFLAVGGYQPLFSWTARILFSLLLLLIWGVVLLLLKLKASKKNREMADDLAADAQEPEPEPDRAGEELDALSSKMVGAMSTLREQSRRGRLGRQYLYELPWYIIIGPPRAGKTTALVNSGLRFPLEEVTGGKKLKGSGGTLDCDWWFTDDAVILDTAGRYTVQDYDRETTRKAWLGFLDMLKKHRPRRPINGILVAMSLPELLECDPVARAAHADAVRARVHELYDTLGVRFPVYLLFTKCDLVSGFIEFYGEFSRQESDEVWGFTLPLSTGDAPDLEALFAEEYDLLMGSLQYHMLRRMRDDDSVERLRRVYTFPRQMNVVADELREFLVQVFHGDRYHAMPWLRGVYFTSGTQEGSPIDHLISELVGVDETTSVPEVSGKKGRSFFLKRLFKDVLFREAEVAGADPKSERRQRWSRVAAYTAAAALLAGGLTVWHLSYRYNSARAAEVGERTVEAQAGIEAHKRIEDPGGRMSDGLEIDRWRTVLSILDPLYAASRAYDDEPWYVAPLGLHGGVELREAADGAYTRALNRYLRPALMGAMEKSMRDNLDNLDFLYETLTSYRTFGDEAVLDDMPEKRLARLTAWFQTLWEYVLQHDRDARDALQGHFVRLFDGRITPAKLDEPLIQLVQRKINELPMDKRALRYVMENLDLGNATDWVLEAELGFDARKVFVSESGDESDWRVPAAYTFAGFERFIDQLPDLLKEFRNEQLALFGKITIDLPRLETQVEALYYAEYIDEWESVVQDLQLYNLNTYKDLVDTTDALSKPTSPLLRFLEALQQNTMIATRMQEGGEALPGSGVKVGNVGAISGKLQSTKARLQAIRRSVSVEGDQPGADDPPGLPVEQRFADLSGLVRDEGGVRPIDGSLRTVAAISSHVLEFQRALTKGAKDIYEEEYRQSQEAIASLEDQAKELPNPLKVWFAAIGRNAREVLTGNACSQLNTLWTERVLPLYERSIDGRFPLARRSATEVKLADFKRFFGPGGALDKFLQQNLKQGLSAIRSQEQMSAQFQEVRIEPAVYDQLRRAAVIMEMFFPYGSADPGVSFELTPETMDPRLSAGALYLGGDKLVYRHEPPRPYAFKWPFAQEKTVRLQFSARDGQSPAKRYLGEWSLFRLLADYPPKTVTSDEYRVDIDLEGYTFGLRLSAESVDNPFHGLSEIAKFRGPRQLCRE
jgi:type VI secretion system protein ImpL